MSVLKIVRYYAPTVKMWILSANGNDGKAISETIVSTFTGCVCLRVVTATPVFTIDTSASEAPVNRSDSSGVVP